jgi:anti-repressor protein
MIKSSTYNHTALQGKNKSTQIKGMLIFAQPEVIPPRPEQTSVVTMSSLEFSALTGKRHDHLMTDIRKMLDERGFNAIDFLDIYEANGKIHPYFNLPQEDVYDLVTGYSVPLRAKVIRRWHELEAQAKKPAYTIPTTLTDALKLAAELEQKLIMLNYSVTGFEQKIAGDAEKVGFYNAMAGTEELFNTGVVAKTFGTSKPKFLNYLRKHEILMGGGNKRNLPYQQHLDAGRLEAAWVNCLDRKTGKRKMTPVPLFTGKGIIWIQQFIEQNGRQGL